MRRQTFHKEAVCGVDAAWMRIRIPFSILLVALFLGSGTALATTAGPSVSEFETGLTPGVQLWGITSGPDGNT
jgi:hypothetical protein